MYHFLLPGMRIKRWILVDLAGMLLFGIGFSLTLNARLGLQQGLWQVWVWFSNHSMPERVPMVTGLALLAGGVALVVFGTRRLIRSFIQAANPAATSQQLMHTLAEQRHAVPRLRILGIGGGTGLSTLLRGLKSYPVDLTVIVTVSDDGGSSGRLRADLDMPPPGDLRNCLVALAEAEPLMEQLFQHRFAAGSSSDNSCLGGHSLGNLVIAGLSEITGDFHQAIQEVSRVLAVRGRVLPSANRPLGLKATMADGSVIAGETAITAARGVITSISIDPPDAEPLPEALQAIREADVIILGPGSVYSSLVPNLLIAGMAEALAASPAIKLFICNVMTQPGESDDFTASRHLEVVLQHLPCHNPFHFAVVNLQRPPQDVLALYAQKGQHFVEPDLARIRALDTTPVTGHLLADTLLARHDHDKLARCIVETLARETNWPQVRRRHG